jgi:lipopolysaccharide transport system ATP-binding protein
MSGDPAAICAEGLSKRYQIGSRTGMAWLARPSETLWALRDVSFDVAPGEAVGIVGRNGAGKSTLLKILARITEPSDGRAVIRGRVGSLLEVGTGFHPELSGRENVFLNGAILGMRKAEIEARFDAIAAFSGVERFLDTPVKRYSSGMRVRLAFAVAAHLDPEILIVDEVLAVGDAEFQRRCLGAMGDVVGTGRTILFVSHNLAAVRSLCTRALWIDDGRLRCEGAVDEVLDRYLAEARCQQRAVPIAERRDRRGCGDLRFTRLELRAGASERAAATTGGAFQLVVGYAGASREPLKNVRMAFTFADGQGNRVFAVDTRFLNADFDELPPAGEIVCEIPELPLTPGDYDLRAWASVSERVADDVEYAAHVEVAPGDFFGTGRQPVRDKHGPVAVRHAWRLARGIGDAEPWGDR